MTNIQTVLNTQYTHLQTHPSFQKIKSMPKIQRWLTFLGLFIISQLIIFSLLYLVFDKQVVIGFFACILAGLATGLGALP
ncbi:MAG: ZIP family metal transporter, partial [Gammaproteobacteria bacterium]|nr:ZIP family metal transporter [Gammaproteobacteria bacterium]